MSKLSCQDLEQAIPLATAARYFPSRPTIYTLRRWATKGLSNGAKLACFKSGQKTCTTLSAIEDFVQAMNADPTAPRRQAGAAAELEAMGV